MTAPGAHPLEWLQADDRCEIYRTQSAQGPCLLKILRRPENLQDQAWLRQDYVIMRSLDLPVLFRPLVLEGKGDRWQLDLRDEGLIPLASEQGQNAGQNAGQNPERLSHKWQQTAEAMKRDPRWPIALALALAQGLQSVHQARLFHGQLRSSSVWFHPPAPAPGTRPSPTEMSEDFGAELQGVDLQPWRVKLMDWGQAHLVPPGEDTALWVQRDLQGLGAILQGLEACSPWGTEQELSLPIQLRPRFRRIWQALLDPGGDRYPTAAAVAADLLELYPEQTTVPPSSLGLNAIAERSAERPLVLPNRIYGRDDEIQLLLEAHGRVAQEGAELFLLTGGSGTGKTALVEAVQQYLQTQDRVVAAYGSLSSAPQFITCKFEQFKAASPLQAILQGMRRAFNNPEFEAAIAAVIQDSAASDVDPDILPAFLVRWLQQVALTVPNLPWILFLDDLHWADPASLRFLQRVLIQGSNLPLLVIGVYREREVSPNHALCYTLELLRQSQVSLQTLNLNPLNSTYFRIWIEAILGGTSPETADLIERLELQTQGNPFFVRQLLLALHQQGELVYDPLAQQWSCLSNPRAMSFEAEDIVEFLARRLATLPEETQLVLQLAACLGNQFRLDQLARLYHSTAQPSGAEFLEPGLLETEIALWPALHQGFLSRLEDASGYRFFHDRIQQAACLLLPGPHHPGRDWAIAQVLLGNLSIAGRDSQIFEIIEQLDPALHPVQDPQRRAQLAQLNLVAGRRASMNQDPAAAIRYFTRGLEWLPERAWEVHYALTLNLHEAAAEAEYRHTNFYRAASLAENVVTHAQPGWDQAQAEEIRIRLKIAAGQFEEALAIAFAFLEQVGTPWVTEPVEPLSQMLLAQLPIMTNRETLLVLRLLSLLPLACGMARPQHLPTLAATMLDLTHRFGVSQYGAVAYSLLAIQRRDPAIAQQALWMINRLQVQEMRGQVLLGVYAQVYVWQVSLVDVHEALVEAVQVSLEEGELETAAQAAWYACSYRFWSGIDLAEVAADYERYQDMLEMLQQAFPWGINRILQRAIAALQTTTLERLIPTQPMTAWWELPDLSALVATLPGDSDAQLDQLAPVRFFYALAQGLLRLLGGQPRAALAALAQATKHQPSIKGLLPQATLVYLSALTLLDLYDTLSPVQRQDAWLKIDRYQVQLQTWAEQAPLTFGAQWELVAAEQARIQGQQTEAIEFYDRAIASAEAQGQGRDLALACERAARFYRQWNKGQLAQAYLRQAHRAYQNWGATAKALTLVQTYPEILQVPDPSAGGRRRQPLSLMPGGHQNPLAMILQAAQRLSTASDWEALVKTLLQVAAELTPAQRLVLLVPTSDIPETYPGDLSLESVWRIEAQAQRQVQQQPDTLMFERLEADDTGTWTRSLSLKLIQTVLRRQSPVLIPAAKLAQAQGRQRLTSVLALPLGGAHPVAVLYLETQGPKTLTALHQQHLELLGQQAAIALIQARTQQSLEQIVEARTQDLRQEIQERRIAEMQLEHQLKRATLLAQITREIRQNLQPQEMFQAAAQAIGMAFQVSRCVIHCYQPEPQPQVIRLAEYAGASQMLLGSPELPLERNPDLQQLLTHDEVVAVTNVYARPLSDEARVYCLRTELKSLLAVRTSYKDQANGVIALHQCNRFREWRAEEISLLAALADQVGLALAQAQLLETEQRQRRDLEQAKAEAEAVSRSKGEFIASLGHELRTPLTAILGFSRLMAQDTALKPEHHRMLTTINESGEHLLKLIEDVMTMAKLEAGRATLALQTVDLEALMRSLQDIFFLQIRLKGLTFQLEFDPQVPRYVQADEGKLRQVLMNLLGNAVKFTEQGTITVRVRSAGEARSLDRTDERWVSLCFEIEDTGPGIAPAELDRLFQEFEQTEVGRRAPGGTGLGLSISRKLVELMGGSIAVESQPEQRTCFRFQIWAEQTLEAPLHSTQLGASLGASGEGRRPVASLTAESLRVMSRDWIERLNAATTLLDQEVIFQVLDEMPEAHRGLRDAIAQLAHQFAYETLIDLTRTSLTVPAALA